MRASTRVSQALVQAAQCLCGTGDRFPQIVWRASHHANRDPRRTAAAWEPIPNDALERFAEGKPRFRARASTWVPSRESRRAGVRRSAAVGVSARFRHWCLNALGSQQMLLPCRKTADLQRRRECSQPGSNR